MAATPEGSPREDPRLPRTDVLVLLGGTSGEREISLASGEAVLAALRTERDAGLGPRSVEPVRQEPDGRFAFGDGGAPLALGPALERLAGADLCFLALHGGDGEDGHVQALLELAGIAFTGSGSRASALAMDKWTARAVVERAGLATPEARCLDRAAWRTGGGEAVAALLERAPDGLCVKPRSGGSSVDTVHAATAGEVEGTALAILEDGEDVLLERWTVGTEVTCAVLGNRGDPLRALPVVEIRPHAGRFFDYEEKYSAGGASELCPPQTLSPEQERRVAERALAAHRELGCDGYSRTDFVVPRDGAEPVYLETNSLPGLTPRSLLPLAAATAGIEFPALCRRILSLALERAPRAVPGRRRA